MIVGLVVGVGRCMGIEMRMIGGIDLRRRSNKHPY